MRKKILLWLWGKYPHLVIDVLLEDFLGIIPKKDVDKSALDFLANNSKQFEPWLMQMAYHLQRENIIHRQGLRKDDFYNGALFIIRLLYSATIKEIPMNLPMTEKAEEIKDPQGDVDTFLSKMKEHKNGQKDV